VIDQSQILSKFKIREDCFNHPDDVDSRLDVLIHVWTTVSLGPDARSTDKEIADSTSTVRMPAFHGPDARIADMIIAC
jgi:hypothetical protein